MSLRVAVRIARREMRGGLRGFRVLLACLILGVAAIAAVGSVRGAIEAGLAREGASILGGDAEIGLTYRFATPSERAWIDAQSTARSEIAEFRSMAATADGEDRALTQVKAVDSAYPLVGAVTLTPAMPLDHALAGNGAVMERDLIERLGLRVGDSFTLGEQSFTLRAELTRVPDATGFALGPTTIVLRTALEGSGLLTSGSLFESKYRLVLPAGADLDRLKTDADEAIGEGYRWQDARNGAPGVSRFVERLGAFLALVGLAGLVVGGVGMSAALRAYMERKTATIATLKTLGAERRVIFLTYLLQIGVLALLGIAVGLMLGALAPFGLAPFAEGRLPVPLELALYPAALGEAAIYGLLVTAIFTLPALARAQGMRAAALYREESLGVSGLPSAGWLAITGVLVALLVAVACWFTGSIRLALGAAAGIGGAFAILVAAAFALRRLARGLSHLSIVRGRPILRLALGAVGGPGGETLSVMLSLGLGLSVLAAVGQTDANLRAAIQQDLPDVAPSYYVVDIQSDQIDSFTAQVTEAQGVSRLERAPMLRGVITRINDRPAEEVSDHWVVRGDRGITYSATPPDNTKVTAGTWWAADYEGPPQISFSAEEAEEMGLALGDSLTINVLGRDITGEITSFREVDFSGAGMGFVLSMSPNALAGAPHTFIATIYADEGAGAPLIRTLTREMPNITAISVRDAIARVAEILTGIAAATALGAAVTLITGAVVLIGAAAAGDGPRRYESAVLKTLGASRAQVLTTLALRAAIVGVLAGIVAILAGGLGAWAVLHFVMEAEFTFQPLAALGVVAAGLALTMLTSLGFALRALAVKPARLLRAED